MAKSDPKQAIRRDTSLIQPDRNPVAFNFRDQIKNGGMTAESESGNGKGEGRVNRSGYFFSPALLENHGIAVSFYTPAQIRRDLLEAKRQKQDAFFIWRKPARQIWVSSFVLRYPRKAKKNWKPKKEE